MKISKFERQGSASFPNLSTPATPTEATYTREPDTHRGPSGVELEPSVLNAADRNKAKKQRDKERKEKEAQERKEREERERVEREEREVQEKKELEEREERERHEKADREAWEEREKRERKERKERAERERIETDKRWMEEATIEWERKATAEKEAKEWAKGERGKVKQENRETEVKVDCGVKESAEEKKAPASRTPPVWSHTKEAPSLSQKGQKNGHAGALNWWEGFSPAEKKAPAEEKVLTTGKIDPTVKPS